MADGIGVFRKAAEISLQILRTNSESLMTVLEAFVHDPLVEWVKVSVSQNPFFLFLFEADETETK
jgi:phosphatidylinositol kinase/protein kinase (PI-3  family)